MTERLKISRKKFFRIVGIIILLPFAWLINKSVKVQIESRQRENKIILPKNIPEGITIYGSVILSKNDESLKVFSSRCTHLGCVINKIDGSEIVCPCHGSRFNKNGIPINGPAAKNLEKLIINVDPKTGEMFVYA